MKLDKEWASIMKVFGILFVIFLVGLTLKRDR
jgi:hypothetical protein